MRNAGQMTISKTHPRLEQIIQELRRRFRYLSHLADGQPFSLVLLDSKDLNLNEDTFLKFKSQIVQRQKRKVQKDKEENKAFQKFEVSFQESNRSSQSSRSFQPTLFFRSFMTENFTENMHQQRFPCLHMKCFLTLKKI